MIFAKMDFQLIFFVFYGILSTATSEKYVFPSGDEFTLVDESTLPDPSLYADVQNTGSLLIDSQESTKTLEKRLGKNVPVSKFMSKVSGARYVRAHPTFMKCLQQVIMKLRQRGIMVELLKGFITSSESTGSVEDQYLQSGCGAELAIASGSSGTVTDIAETAFKVCPVIVEREMRDLYVKLMSGKVHFHMAGPEPTGPTFMIDGVNGITDPKTQAEVWTNEGLEPPADTDCSNFSTLASGEHYPARFNHERVLGNIDVKVTRNMTEFGRLVQYQGTNIEFENSEAMASWCGQAGNTCPSTCANGLQGNTLNERCADRIMSSRLLAVLNKLQRKARKALNDKLKVLEAWDEPYDGQDQGDSADDPLHYEGRAVKVTLSSGSTVKLGELSKYAICAGADYVEHRGTYLYIGAKAYTKGGAKVLFPNIELLEVDVPIAVENLYKLPSAFSEKEKSQYPLFDGSGKLNATLSSGVTVGQFVSKNYRYFRLNPRLHDCYIDIVYHENKRQKSTDAKIEIEVVRGFLTNIENNRKFDVINDKRFNRHNLGLALQLKYKESPNLPATHTPYRLFKTAIDKCAPRFYMSNNAMGIGLYKDSIFVDMRAKFHIMKQSVENLPVGVNPNTFEDEMERRFYLARGGKIVDPENVTSACLFQTAPKPQSQDFKHVHSEVVERKRRRKRSDDDNSCVPTRYTKFCSSTEPHRQAVIDDITGMLDRKHYRGRTRNEIMGALKGCLLDCGTCLDGEIYFSKTEHCNNLLHWVDWTLLNDKPDVSNFFVRSNRNANIHACEGGNDCIENAPLFSLFAPSVETIYRPDPKKSVEAELYSIANNPSPVFRLMEDIYAIQASGIVKFWVRDDTEMTALTRQLEVVMLYNKNVTLVQIHVERYRIARDAVKSVVEKAATSMAINGCPEVARETLTPYEILEVPAEKKKRAAEPASLRYQIRDYHKNFEARWANRHILL
ncbi:uncharacterized protein LOC123562054 [Mercenaria mercenaria]|uniref:uncharacterized protein LOC123562054 n=1 Tax=Mercenaria mercenaria TaxID=6596 RepID=UPI00234E57E6|nr:uncharacterized protein LOC123562054 [Mercenaria mercenaria]